MAGSRPKFRHLSRNSAHRQALLRNLLDKLLEHESITTTYAKAKEAQKLVEKVITMGKTNTPESKRRATSVLYRPQQHLPKIFGELRQRYATRAGGYTRVQRIEPPKEDQAPSAILELVDGPRDMHFALTARTLAYRMRNKLPLDTLTKLNVKKATQFRPNGGAELKDLVAKFALLGDYKGELPEKKAVYPDPMRPFPAEQRQRRLQKISLNAPWWDTE